MDNYSDEFYQVRSLTDDFVFCPKCGTKNIFKLSRTGTQLNYFCERCSEKLNDYWEGAFTGQLSIAMCKACQQSTFEELKYCVSCGSIQRRVARKRAREISKTIGDSQLKEDIISVTVGSGGFFGPDSRMTPLRLIILIVSCIFSAIIAVVIYYLSVGMFN